MRFDDVTPIDSVNDIFVKRDDLFSVSGSRGGKVRTCLALANEGVAAGGSVLVSAGSRQSPQIEIVSDVAVSLGLTAEVVVPQGPDTPQIVHAFEAGSMIHRVFPGYNNVLSKRARDLADTVSGSIHIPFGMECDMAVTMTALQCSNLPDVKRIVVPVGSGMSTAGILSGTNFSIPVLGVCVGASPVKRLNKYAPGWESVLTLVNAGVDYHKAVHAKIGPIELDPIYESKCLPFLQSGDLFWIVGKRR